MMKTDITLKDIIAFIGGLIITGVIYAVILFLFVLSTFSLSGETLTEKENRDAFVFFTSFVITGLTIKIIFRQYNANRKFTASGIAVTSLLAVSVTVLSGNTFFKNLNFYQPFNKKEWVSNEFKPFNMAKTLAKYKTLIGQTKEQIIELLGTSNQSFKNENVDYLYYSTDNSGWKLQLYFSSNKIKEAFLYEQGF